jgi:hypothetical protein
MLKLWCIRKGNKLVDGDYFDNKMVAKGVRNSYEGIEPNAEVENPDNAANWHYHVSRGPDHRKN